MNAEQKQRALQMLRRFEQAAPMSLQVDNAAVDMAALLHELIDAPEPEPVGYTNETELDYVRTYESLPVSGAFWPTSDEDANIALYTAPPTPSVPDEQLQAAFDRGLKAGNEQAIAQQIEIHKLHDLLAVQQPEQSDDLVRDAERYRWLRACNSGSLMITHLIGIGDCDEIVLTGNDADEAIDAAIAAEKGNKND